MTQLHTWHYDIDKPWSGKRDYFCSANIGEFISLAKCLSIRFYKRHGIWLGFRTSVEGSDIFDSAWSEDLSWLSLFTKNPQFGLAPQSSKASDNIQACWPSSGDMEVLEKCADTEHGYKTLSAYLECDKSRIVVDSLYVREQLNTHIEDKGTVDYWHSCRRPLLPTIITAEDEYFAFEAEYFETNIVAGVKDLSKQVMDMASRHYMTTVAGNDGIKIVVESQQRFFRLIFSFSPGGWETTLFRDYKLQKDNYNSDEACNIITFWLIYGWLPMSWAL